MWFLSASTYTCSLIFTAQNVKLYIYVFAFTIYMWMCYSHFCVRAPLSTYPYFGGDISTFVIHFVRLWYLTKKMIWNWNWKWSKHISLGNKKCIQKDNNISTMDEYEIKIWIQRLNFIWVRGHPQTFLASYGADSTHSKMLNTLFSVLNMIAILTCPEQLQ